LQAGWGLERDATRPGRKAPLDAAVIERVVTPDAAREATGDALVGRALSPAESSSAIPASSGIWAAHGLKPHLTKTFKLSNDKQFVEKVTDVVSLYLNPPDRALVL